LTPPDAHGGQPIPGPSAAGFGMSLPDDSIVVSPLKRHRPSIAEGVDDEHGTHSSPFPPALGDILAKAEAAQQQKRTTPTLREEDEDEEL